MKVKSLITIVMCALHFSCNQSSETNESGKWGHLTDLKEYQLTGGAKGHFLNQTQCFSPDDNWIVYDTRNDDTHIGQTCCIEMVNVATKESRLLYKAENQTVYGPGVGAAAFNPQKNEVLFIHGLQNCDAVKPYGFTRRTGVLIDVEHPGKPVFMDARDIHAPFTPGALRGGTHAYSWSGDGRWASFTYNDAVISGLAKRDTLIRDLRAVGVMAPLGPVRVEEDGKGENISGKMFSVVATVVTEDPEPGSDEIDKAYEECWVGTEGYKRPDSTRQRRAVAFLGDVRDRAGKLMTEVFIADIPEDITRSAPGRPLEGTAVSRPALPAGISQRRLTFTAGRRYPGVQGPRHWLRSSPDGSLLFFLMKNKKGIVQVYSVSPNGGEIKQITKNDFSIETSFSVSPDGRYIAYGYGQDVYISSVSDSSTIRVSTPVPENSAGLGALNWSNNGKILAYNRKIMTADSAYYQIFVLK